MSGRTGASTRRWEGLAQPGPSADADDARSADPDADPESVARKILLDTLTGQARSRQELKDRLDRRAVPHDVGEALLDRFEEVGLVDDQAFARQWVSSRQQSKGLARRALADELRRKGIDDDVARLALDDVAVEAEREAAQKLVQKKLRTMRNLPEQTATRRLVGMLARKGYSSGVAFSVVREELKSQGEEDSSDFLE